ncbi:MAG: hypothetical protein IPM52_07730 [Bacteroidetes bacterium]|nr:hypothetical protein [Bacteroidota bacterium]
MKRLMHIVLALQLLLACNSPSRMIKNEQYDQAIERLVRSARAGKADAEDLQLLSRAYHTANQLDHDRIQMLKVRNEAADWPEIMRLYERMNVRQTKIKTLSSDQQAAIGFVPMNLDMLIADARREARQQLLETALNLLATGKKQEARLAYDHLTELQRLSPNDPEVRRQLQRAEQQGTSQVLVLFENRSGVQVPDEFAEVIMNMSAANLDQPWLSFNFEERSGMSYDYVVYASVRTIAVSPEMVSQSRFTEKKEIQDGTQPKRDENGNIMLDSTGKVIEVPKYRTIEAFVNQTLMEKRAKVGGLFDFVQPATGKTLRSIPFESEAVFTYTYGTINGDLRAASVQSLEMMRRNPVPFPPDGVMLMEAAQKINPLLRNALKKESNLLLQVD